MKTPKELSQFPKNIIKDTIKWVLIPAKVILDGVSLWPENHNNFRKCLILLCFTSLIFVMAGHIYYLAKDTSDLVSASFVIIMFIAVIESLARQVLIVYHRKNLLKILNVIYYDFWPSDVNGTELEKKVNRYSWFVITYCSVYTTSAFLCVVQLLMTPLLNNNKNLVFLSTYPFAYWKSPVYEILHVWHFFAGEAPVFIICGVDLFFVALLWNCIGQFILLRNFLCGNFEKCLNGNEMEVIVKCVRHHDLLIRVCKEMENVFTYFILLLFLANIGTVCISCFVATVMPQEIGTCITYFIGHFSQLFIYCYMGSQLIEESTALSDVVFHCGWHLSENTKRLRNSLIMLMVRSQQGQHITAGGFSVLELSSFMEVVKFSFSVYTLLNSFIEK